MFLYFLVIQQLMTNVLSSEQEYMLRLQETIIHQKREIEKLVAIVESQDNLLNSVSEYLEDHEAERACLLENQPGLVVHIRKKKKVCG